MVLPHSEATRLNTLATVDRVLEELDLSAKRDLMSA